MSQNVQDKSNPKHAPKHASTSEQKQQEPPVTDVSPDDPIEVKVGTGVNGQRQK